MREHRQDRSQPPLIRKKLGEMSPTERRAYYTERRADLVDFRQYIQRYLDRRERSGQQTTTDERYRQFQQLAADLIAALEELSEADDQ